MVWLVILLCLTAALVKWRRKIWTIISTLPRDLRLVRSFLQMSRLNARLRAQNATPGSMLSELARKSPDQPCILYKDQIWTFKQMDEMSWRVARVFHRLGLARGDVIALFCTNMPEYLGCWLGLSRLGVISALVNTNLRADALRHTLTVAKPSLVIASPDLCQAVLEARDSLCAHCPLYVLRGGEQEGADTTGFTSLDTEIQGQSSEPLAGLTLPRYEDKLMYIYTSGTTGLPKAAVILNSRFLYCCVVSVTMFSLTPRDRLYCPLPLYHTAGGIIAVGPALCFGTSVVIRDKFSASAYWRECAQYHCTAAQYIGEVCRYLLATPPSPWDRAHRVRVAAGNGLRAAIWTQFRDRFGLKQIIEIYGATEGNANMANLDGKVGAVGCLPSFLPSRLCPLVLVKVDLETGHVVREGSDQHCVICKPDEPGMLLGKIREGDATRDYKGYLDKSASEKKIEQNVFEKGDRFFISGDIFTMDAEGYLYFKDRTGDTFRWKGENVSTAEVESAISRALGHKDVVVYGVQIPGTEGRAGMAAILEPESLNLSELEGLLGVTLPGYAQPLFLRLLHRVDLTGTFKLKKTDLQNEGFDLDKVTDPVYFRSSSAAKFEPLTQKLYHDILDGKIRV